MAIVLVLLLAGGAGAYWISANNPLTTLQQVEPSSPRAGIFISRQAPMVVSLLVNPDRLTTLGFATVPPLQRKSIQTQWTQFRQALLTNSQLDYTRDIQPWLGNELTFAITTPDVDRNANNGKQPGYLVAAAVTDLDQATRSLQTYWKKRAKAGVSTVSEQFAGIQIFHSNPVTPKAKTKPSAHTAATDLADSSEPFTLSTAVVGDRFVLFANHPNVLRDAINNLQVPELSINTSDSYQTAIERLSTSSQTDPHIGLMVVQLPQTAAWWNEAGHPVVTKPGDEPPTFDRLVVALQPHEQGIIGDALLLTTFGKEISPAPATLNGPVQALQHIPANSPLVAAGSNLHQLWSRLETGTEGYELLKELINQPIKNLEQRSGVHLASELFSHLDDEYALGLLPHIRSQPDWILVAKRSPQLDETLAQLEAVAQEHDISSKTFTIANQPVTVWTKLYTTQSETNASQQESLTIQAEVQGGYTSIGNYEIFATSLDAITQVLQAENNPLLAAEAFQTAVTSLPTPNNGYLYVNWQQLTESLMQSPFVQSLASSEAQPFFDRLQSVTFASKGSENNAVRGHIFWHL